MLSARVVHAGVLERAESAHTSKGECMAASVTSLPALISSWTSAIELHRQPPDAGAAAPRSHQSLQQNPARVLAAHVRTDRAFAGASAWAQSLSPCKSFPSSPLRAQCVAVARSQATAFFRPLFILEGRPPLGLVWSFFINPIVASEIGAGFHTNPKPTHPQHPSVERGAPFR